jgi:hypothetical protein
MMHLLNNDDDDSTYIVHDLLSHDFIVIRKVNLFLVPYT